MVRGARSSSVSTLDGSAQEETLHQVAAVRTQELELRGILHPLRHQLQAEIVAEVAGAPRACAVPST
jgi:hypothetical protein